MSDKISTYQAQTGKDSKDFSDIVTALSASGLCSYTKFHKEGTKFRKEIFSAISIFSSVSFVTPLCLLWYSYGNVISQSCAMKKSQTVAHLAVEKHRITDNWLFSVILQHETHRNHVAGWLL
jgi:hypothetical protein